MRQNWFGRVDPDCIGEWRGLGWFAGEALGMLREGCGEDSPTIVEDIRGEAIVGHVRREHGDARSCINEKGPPVGASIFDRQT